MQRWCWRFLTQLQSEPTDCSSVCSGTKFTEREENIWQRPLTPVCHTEDRRISLCFFQLWASLPKNLLCKYVRLLPVLKRFLVACEWAFSQSDADVTQINTYMFSTSCPELKPSGSSSLRGFSGLNLSCETECGADTASLCLWLLFSLTTASWLLCTTLSWAVPWLDRRVSPASPLWELSANHRWSWRGLTR